MHIDSIHTHKKQIHNFQKNIFICKVTFLQIYAHIFMLNNLNTIKNHIYNNIIPFKYNLKSCMLKSE